MQSDKKKKEEEKCHVHFKKLEKISLFFSSGE
jgi:hypothetical protein